MVPFLALRTRSSGLGESNGNAVELWCKELGGRGCFLRGERDSPVLLDLLDDRLPSSTPAPVLSTKRDPNADGDARNPGILEVKMGGVCNVYSSSNISVVTGDRSPLCLAFNASLDILAEVGVG